MKSHDFSSLKSIYINCTLKKSPEKSHTSTLIQVSKRIMEREKVEVGEIRSVDHEIATGIYPDMKEHGWEKDEWPSIFQKVMDHDNKLRWNFHCPDKCRLGP